MLGPQGPRSDETPGDRARDGAQDDEAGERAEGEDGDG